MIFNAKKEEIMWKIFKNNLDNILQLTQSIDDDGSTNATTSNFIDNNTDYHGFVTAFDHIPEPPQSPLTTTEENEVYRQTEQLIMIQSHPQRRARFKSPKILNPLLFKKHRDKMKKIRTQQRIKKVF